MTLPERSAARLWGVVRGGGLEEEPEDASFTALVAPLLVPLSSSSESVVIAGVVAAARGAISSDSCLGSFVAVDGRGGKSWSKSACRSSGFIASNSSWRSCQENRWHGVLSTGSCNSVPRDTVRVTRGGRGVPRDPERPIRCCFLMWAL